jgi:hypothetical protein
MVVWGCERDLGHTFVLWAISRGVLGRWYCIFLRVVGCSMTQRLAICFEGILEDIS